MSTDLSKLQQDGLNEVATRFAHMVKRSVDVMEVADRTFELPRDADGELVRPPGMEEATFNIHKDAMLPPKSVPFYLSSHRTRIETAQKIAGDRATAPQEIARRIVKVLELPKREYEVVDVTFHEKP